MKLPTILAGTLALVHIFSEAEVQDLRVPVPHTQPAIMIDGVLSPDEWQSAKMIDAAGVALLYFQQSADFVYIAVQYKTSPSGIVDLYLSPSEGEVYNLHASAKLGERKLQANGYSDWSWWNNRDWTANVSRVHSFEARTFLPTPLREFQIRRARFPSVTWRLRFELTAMTTKNETQAISLFPRDTTDKATTGWLVLDLT